ncbi:DUF397 domain-containing protein [Actinomadura sp. GTD37]|uniref:DUF397 domain-containing protein n=1 Tax=Actinomadura sp. GTD37 TaxID=1778030 RepID=UPI0035C016FE
MATMAHASTASGGRLSRPDRWGGWRYVLGVEVRAWQKSSHSADEGECVEVAASQAMVLARDSKDPGGPVLGFGAGAWGIFRNTVKRGSLDLP